MYIFLPKKMIFPNLFFLKSYYTDKFCRSKILHHKIIEDTKKYLKIPNKSETFYICCNFFTQLPPLLLKTDMMYGYFALSSLVVFCQISVFPFHYWSTRSLGALRAPTSSWGPFGPRLLVGGPSGPDFVLRALRALRPRDPRR